MRFFNFLIIPVFLSFTDCDKPREPAQPVSTQSSLSRSAMGSAVGFEIRH